MKKRVLAVILTVMMLWSIFCGLVTVQAAEYNTAVRHEVCTALSADAEAYYTGNYSFTALTASAGSDSGSSLETMDSPLFEKLHTLMSSTMTSSVSYKSLTGYWKYTDSEKGSSDATLFYSDETSSSYNREHVWPKSHGSFYQKNAGADLHHLRPTNSTINSTRNNYVFGNVKGVLSSYSTKAYNGKTVLWYKSGQLVEVADNVKGDVARILLYVYVRWEQPNLFENVSSADLPPKDSDDSQNTGGKVIESLDTLLEWCENDPVDEWEMRRNDLTEDIQGNRNVFIDYPELAFMLFDRDVPADMPTPSGAAAEGEKYTVYAFSSNTAHGTVSAEGYTVTVAPTTGYYLSDYYITPQGAATVTRDGNTFYLTDVSSNCQFHAVFAENEKFTLHYILPEGCTAPEDSVGYAGDSITLPTLSGNYKDLTFVGWTASTVEKTTEKPTYYTVGSSYILTENSTLYPLFCEKATDGNGTAEQYLRVTEDRADWSGNYVMAGNVSSSGTAYLFDTVNGEANAGSANAAALLSATGMTLSEDTLSGVSEQYVLTVEKVNGTDYYTFRLSGAQHTVYLAYKAGSGNSLSVSDDPTDPSAQWQISYSSGVSVTNVATPARALYFNASAKIFRCYTSAQSRIQLFAAGTPTVTYYMTAEDETAPDPDPTPSDIFDVNQDGEINILDVTVYLDQLATDTATDLNDDGAANSGDVTALLDVLATL